MRLHRPLAALLAIPFFAACPVSAEETAAASPDTLLNPLRQYRKFRPIRPFVADLDALVDRIKTEGLASEVSVYFRALNDGVWHGIGEKRRFAPASLMKVPILMMFLKDAEKDPSVLQKRYPYKAARAFVQFVPPRTTLVAGKLYTVEELLEAMIVHSDNNAFLTLLEHLDAKTAEKTYVDLGYATTFLERGDFLSLKTYAGTFRVLYNSTFLGEEMSAKALDMLTRSRMECGLREGIPADVRVAHKFGEFNSPDMKHSKQLHDVGIVYYRDNPYILGVMTRGDDYEKMCKAIGLISKFVYDELETQYREQREVKFQFEDEG